MSIKLHGKEYIEVKDRVAAALADDAYQMLKEETFSMGGREYVRVYIDVKGKQFIGTAECKFGANPKTPDGMSPFECGETSALGRALGFAGYGIVESIASADEVARNIDEAPGESRPTQLTSSISAPTPFELQKLFKGIQQNIDTAQNVLFKKVKPIDNLTPEECATLKALYDKWKATFDERQKSA